MQASSLVLPVHIDEAGAARGHGVLVITLKRTKFAGVVLRRMIRCEVDDDFDPVLMSGGDEVVKLGPCIVVSYNRS